jgi:hypothetical protein
VLHMYCAVASLTSQVKACALSQTVDMQRVQTERVLYFQQVDSDKVSGTKSLNLL